jgi:glucose/mannose-6-phosphate isomerase
MTMRESIAKFNEQFAWNPVIENGGEFLSFLNFKYHVFVGMGGSHLAGDLARFLNTGKMIIPWRDYGLPNFLKFVPQESVLVACCSYSGNTEEVIDAYHTAGEAKFFRIAIASGGEILELAKKDGVPFIQLPKDGLQPRWSLGCFLRAALKFLSAEEILKSTDKLAELVRPDVLEKEGREISEELRGKIPVVYSSLRNSVLSFIWKVNFNETAKIPAFTNIFPEMNHNEINGFDRGGKTGVLSENIRPIFLNDETDSPKIIKRMSVVSEIFRSRGIEISAPSFKGEFFLERFFNSMILSGWISLFLADYYGVDPEGVPIVEELKREMKK